MTFDPKALDWDTLVSQIRHNPDPNTRKEATREAMERIWDGPNQPPERINPNIFDPSW